MTRSRVSTILFALVLLLSAAVAPVAAHGGPGGHPGDLPTRIELPNGFRPEGIESWGRKVYAGSLADGAIWKADAVTGKGRILVPGVEGRAAAGLHLDAWGRLWVAGAQTGTIRVYRALTGRLLRTYTFPTTGFINDLDITRGAVYATDSINQQLAVVPLGRWGKLPPSSAARTLPLTGDIHYIDGFNANGIAARNGYLIVVQSNTGQLFRVNPRTGVARLIDTGGYSVSFGDGLELQGRTLYVVRNQLNLVAALRLSHDLLHARLFDEITAAPGELAIPTTATTTLGALWVVNARFDTTPTATTPYWITRLPLAVAAGGRSFSIRLTGANEVPGPGDPDATGKAYLLINPGQGKVCWSITVANVEPITAAHIHLAPAGTAGPVVVPLEPYSGACSTVDKALARAIVANPSAYYVNVHNAPYPAGAARGQLSRHR